MTQSPNRNWYDEVSPWTLEGLAKYYADLERRIEFIRRQHARSPDGRRRNCRSSTQRRRQVFKLL